jgi:hypothetical protein
VIRSARTEPDPRQIRAGSRRRGFVLTPPEGGG